MIIRLRKIGPGDVIADKSCDYPGNILPARARALDPSAAASFYEDGLREVVVVSDMRRSAASSKLAVETKKGALPPGWSPHGYGEALDLEVSGTMKNLEITGRGFVARKKQLDAWMAKRGWYCVRTDGKDAREMWHFGFLGVDGGGFLKAGETTTQHAMERKLQSMFKFTLTPTDIQFALAGLGMYDGELDGKIGPLSRHAILAFQRAWGLKPDGVPGTITQRCLAFVAAEIVYV